jgi:hypothetical protein
LALLFIGIHNVWDLAVWITVERPGVQEPQKKADSAAASASRASSSSSATSAPAAGDAAAEAHD